ncbi:MAG TPA: ribonuclease P protein component [Candidatus Aminicenantes bacterium]|nr:ribonuclease P protein component [Candidatus Aminicenantes bacterium]
MSETLRPRERLRRQKDFLRIYSNGHRYKGRYFVIIHLPNNLDYSRMAVVVSKKHGQAVIRNRIKRWARELFRRHKELIVGPRDLIFIPRREIQQADWKEIVSDYQKFLITVSSKSKRTPIDFN